MNTILKITILLGLFLFGSTYSFASNNFDENLPDEDRFEIKNETVRDNIIIHLSDEGDWEYMIFTIDGSCVRMGLLSNGKNKISLKNMCKGEYFVYLTNGTHRYMEKVEQ
jgi:hypothetical protein